MRRKTRPSVCAMVRTISVLAVPGSPVIRQWPPTNSAIRISSSPSAWPTITSCTCARMLSRTVWKRSMRCFSSAGSWVVSTDGVGIGDRPSEVNQTTSNRLSGFSLLRILLRVFELQQQLLRRPIARRGFERGEHLLFRLVELMRGEVGLREVVERARLVVRLQRHHRGIFAHGAVVVLLREEQIAEMAMQFFIQRIDLVDRVERRCRLAQLAGILLQR